ncbi:hypothetical protein ACI65C_002491 [Semiaphis heraclei]
MFLTRLTCAKRQKRILVCGRFSRQQNTRAERYRTRWLVAYGDINARSIMMSNRRRKDSGHRGNTKKNTQFLAWRRLVENSKRPYTEHVSLSWAGEGGIGRVEGEYLGGNRRADDG